MRQHGKKNGQSVCFLFTGAGIENLKDAIKELVWSGEIKTEMLQVMINSSIRMRSVGLAPLLCGHRSPPRRSAIGPRRLDLRIAVNAIGEIVGKTTTEDLLDTIFSQSALESN